MATYNPLSWQNEAALSNHPFELELEVKDVIVDAKFVQFDNFIPVLNHIEVERNSLRLTITFDYGQNNSVLLLKSDFIQGDKYKCVRIYDPSGYRYMGTLTIGAGAYNLWDLYVGRKLTYNIPFASYIVRSIPSKDAVYLFDDSFGDIELGRTLDDTTIFYNTAALENNSTGLNAIIFNAVGGHAIDVVENVNGIKKINLVPPDNNNITLSSNEVIKINTDFNTLTINLVAGKPSATFSVPSLIA